MSAKTLIIGVVGVGCVVAAAAGGFYALRLNGEGVEQATVVTAEPAAPAAAASATRTPSPANRTVLPAAEVETRDAPAVPRAAATRSATPASDGANRPRVDGPGRPPAQETPARTDMSRPATPSGAEIVSDPLPQVPPALPVIDPATPPVVAPVIETLPAPPSPEVPRRRFVELTVVEGSVLGLRLETSLATDTAKVEDPVSALVTRDVTVNDLTAIPAGARLEGHVTLVERGGRFRERARLGIRFTTLVLDDNTRMRIDTDPIYRDGESPTGEATSKIGASAVIGSILGAVIGGKKGAAIGSAAGAAGGAAAVAAGGPNGASFTTGAALTVRMARPLTVTIERHTNSER